MEYKEIDFKELESIGKHLSNSYQDKGNTSPVLLDGVVYKRFNGGFKKKEKLILQLDKLNLKYLAKIRAILTYDGKTYGYAYSYDRAMLLKKYLETAKPFYERLFYINQVLETDAKLVNEGLTYFDYHSANLLAGNNIRFIDIDSIKNYTSLNRPRIKRSLFELILSIFINYDLTFNGDNTCYLNIIANYFAEVSIFYDDSLDIRKLGDIMLNKSEDEALSLQREIKKMDM